MKPNNAVEHVSLTEIVMWKQRQLPKSLFDGSTGMPGIKMQLSSIGVLCIFNHGRFVIPYAKCGTITLAAESKETTKESA